MALGFASLGEDLLVVRSAQLAFDLPEYLLHRRERLGRFGLGADVPELSGRVSVDGDSGALFGEGDFYPGQFVELFRQVLAALFDRIVHRLVVGDVFEGRDHGRSFGHGASCCAGLSQKYGEGLPSGPPAPGCGKLSWTRSSPLGGVAEADGNRTRRGRVAAPPIGFEVRARHQPRERFRVPF